jgi:transposase
VWKKNLRRIRQGLKKGVKGIIVFMDEAGFSLHPRLGLVWAKRGSKPSVPTTSCRKRLNLVGWVAPWEGWHGFMSVAKGNTDAFLLFLRYLHNRLKGFIIYLYADGPYWHKGERVREALKEYSNIHLEYLPPYHPEMNPQERIWRFLRYEVTTNHYFPEVRAISVAIRKKQRQIKPKKIIILCKVT